MHCSLVETPVGIWSVEGITTMPLNKLPRWMTMILLARGTLGGGSLNADEMATRDALRPVGFADR